jgi:uncharacterized protein YbjT (DUF2867 family)
MARTVAVVAGATGMTGRYLMQTLGEDAFYDDVIALRREDGLATLHARQIPGATHLFCCLGTTIRKAGGQAAFREVDYAYVLRFARAGREAGAAAMMVVSSVGADSRSSSFYLRVKGDMEEALAGLGFDALHIFRPSILLGQRPESRPGEQWGVRLALAFEWAMAGALRKYKPMPAGLLAASMAAAGERGAAGIHVHQYDEIMGLAGG